MQKAEKFAESSPVSMQAINKVYIVAEKRADKVYIRGYKTAKKVYILAKKEWSN